MRMLDAQSATRVASKLSQVSRPPRSFVGALLLVALCLLCYLPGVILLPPIDRTEVIFADTTRDMVARGAWLDPGYPDLDPTNKPTADPYSPVGTNWLQGLALLVRGTGAAKSITTYRIPSVVAVTTAVLVLYGLSLPLLGVQASAIAAAFFAVSPLTVVVATLAIANGLALLSATTAMMVLLRLYVSGPDAGRPWLMPLLLWTSIGIGMLVSALEVPILIAVTIAALWIADRDISWLKATRPHLGIPLALLLGAPWISVRALQDGFPYAGLGLRQTLDALSGPQHMKFKAAHGAFLFASALGFLPGLAVLPNALARLWSTRHTRLARFLLAWIVAYLAFLELLSLKPATYSVQLLFPALAVAVALMVVEVRNTVNRLWFSIGVLPLLAAIATIAFLSAPYAVTRTWPPAWVPPLILAAGALSLFAGKSHSLQAWAPRAALNFAIFAATLLGAVMPSIDVNWPTRQIARLVATCPHTPLWTLGYREPSLALELPIHSRNPEPDAIVRSGPDVLHLVESRWLDRYRDAAARAGSSPQQLGCVEAFNFMSGLPLTLVLFAPGPGLGHCAIPATYACAKAVSDQGLPQTTK
jgi:4-amino-4-deoxy-L-arabinose transferase-like glycosyltransferase